MKKNTLTKLTNKNLFLPCPSNINAMWSFGSILSICLMTQIITGLFLSMHYCPDISMAFYSVNHITRDTNLGWFIRSLHANGCSMIFLIMYIHISRNIYFNSFSLKATWNSGIMILFMMMATAFIGYVLPWGQMSFWGASVITNLISSIPYIGNYTVSWVWGGFSVNNATLNRFFSLHFLLPFMMILFIMIHLLFLHETGSSNPIGVNSNIDKLPFHPFFTTKDLIGFFLMIFLLIILSLLSPMMFNDPENFIPANPMATPPHIQPEWYFLFAYTILRAIPNKLGGVIALILSILLLFSLPLTSSITIQSNKFYPLNKFMIWLFIMNILLLTWIGMMPVQFPYINIGMVTSFIHFLFFLLYPLMTFMWNKIN
uniref:Cytochrome b n=1 Tax=Anoplodactylus australis TaxID=2992006 RepID=A0A9E7V7D3_9CHEL|nr:cob [Anoplodactylus australis]UZA61246.1 cytochrome b [Anoplodactylus australis]